MSTTQTAEEHVRVELSPDKQRAWLEIPARLPRNQVTEARCKEALVEAGVRYTSEVARRLQQVLSELPPTGEAVEVTLATGIAAVDGQDGALTWFVSEPEQVDEDTSFYERCAYVLVGEGQVIGQIEPETEGEAGLDVMGNAVQPTPGRPPQIRLDETIHQDEDNRLIAQVGGKLVRQCERAYITQELEIADSVDFSTGNLDFAGNILVNNAVRDRFRVQASGHIEVRGLIETASIEAGRDLVARGGVAGRRRGELTVGEDLIARHLNRAQADIGGDLYFEREVIDSLLSVTGKVEARSGTLLGGILVAGGSVEVKVAGSDAGTATELVLGVPPRLRQTLHQTHMLRNQAELKLAELDSLQEEQDRPQALGAPPSSRQKQKRQEYEQQIDKLTEARRSLLTAFERDREIHVTVLHKLHQGVILTSPEGQWQVTKDLTGPIHLVANESGQLTFRQGDSGPRPVSRIARWIDAIQ